MPQLGRDEPTTQVDNAPRSAHPPARPKKPGCSNRPLFVTEQIDVGLKVGTPFLDTYAQNRCTATNTGAGIGLSYCLRGLQLLTGILAALFIAGFTGIVRKT
jgi:hypothetical protein